MSLPPYPSTFDWDRARGGVVIFVVVVLLFGQRPAGRVVAEKRPRPAGRWPNASSRRPGSVAAKRESNCDPLRAARSRPHPGRPMSELLTKKEAAALLRVSCRTLDRWRSVWRAKKKNALGEVKIGKQARFRREMIERLFTTPGLWLA